MKKITLLIAFSSICISVSFAQTKEIKYAIANNSNELYVTVLLKKPYDKIKVDKACKNLGYSIYDSQIEYYSKYGREAAAYKSIKIAKQDEVIAYNRHQEYLAQQQKIKKRERQAEMVKAVVAGAVVVGAAVNEGIKSFETSSSSNYSSSPNNSSQSNNDCTIRTKKTEKFKSIDGVKYPILEVDCRGFGSWDRRVFYRTKGSFLDETGFYSEGFSIGYLGKTEKEALEKICNCR